MKSKEEIVSELKRQFNDTNCGWNQMSIIERTIQYLDESPLPAPVPDGLPYKKEFEEYIKKYYPHLFVPTPVKSKKDEWIKGYACAVAKLIEKNGINDTYSDELFREGIGTIQKAINAGVDENDLIEFEKYYK